jgi:hypothetical protein
MCLISCDDAPLNEEVSEQNGIGGLPGLGFIYAASQLLIGAKSLVNGHFAEYRIVISTLVCLCHLSVHRLGRRRSSRFNPAIISYTRPMSK